MIIWFKPTTVKLLRSEDTGKVLLENSIMFPFHLGLCNIQYYGIAVELNDTIIIMKLSFVPLL